MIRTLRAFFLGRLLREKLLLVGFVLLGVLIWASNFSRRASLFWRQQHATTLELNEQNQWLANRANIEASAQKSAGLFVAERTLDATRLYAEVQKLALEAGLKPPGLGEQRDELGGQFILHSLQVSLSQADWDALLKFYQSLKARSPYIGIEQFSLQVDGSNPNRYHRASLRVSSVEIVH